MKKTSGFVNAMLRRSEKEKAVKVTNSAVKRRIKKKG